MSTLRVNTLQNTSGVEVYTAKAWVNFNGTGTVAIRASGNVSSITDNGTGSYTVNFTNAMVDTNYCITVASNGDNDITSTGDSRLSYPAILTSSCPIRTYRNSDLTLQDNIFVSAAIFR
jgi:hypothetical protein